MRTTFVLFFRVVASLGLFEVGALDGDLPSALAPTLYARFGDVLFLLMLFGTGIAAILGKIYL